MDAVGGEKKWDENITLFKAVQKSLTDGNENLVAKVFVTMRDKSVAEYGIKSEQSLAKLMLVIGEITKNEN